MSFDYEIYLDVDRDGKFTNGLGDISQYVISCSWGHGLSNPWDSIAAAAGMSIIINNAGGEFGLTDPDATYYGKLTHGSLIRVRVSYNGITTQLTALKIKDIQYLPDASQSNGIEHQLQITCEDIVGKFLSQEFNPELKFDVRADEALTEIFEQAEYIYPYDGSWFYIGTSEIGGSDIIYDYAAENHINFEEGYTVLPYSGDNLDRGTGAKIQSYIRDLMKAEFAGIFFWDVRNEQFKFFHRHHNRVAQKSPYIERTSSHTFYMEDIVNAQPVYGEGLANKITVNYYPRKVGTPDSVIAESNATPFAIAAQDSVNIKLRFRDPDNPDASVGGMDVFIPERGLDIIGNSAEDGTGYDWTEFVETGVVTLSAEEIEIRFFVRKVGDPVFITTFQVRGTPLISYQRESIEVLDTESRRLYDKVTRSPDNGRLIADAFTAQQYANHLIGLHRTPDLFYRSITLIPKTPAITEQIQTREIGDIITIHDSHDDNTNYMIVGERHDINLETALHMATWTLRPVKYGNLFLIGTSEIGGPDILLA